MNPNNRKSGFFSVTQPTTPTAAGVVPQAVPSPQKKGGLIFNQDFGVEEDWDEEGFIMENARGQQKKLAEEKRFEIERRRLELDK